MTTETLSKLYLELANVLPETTKSSREIKLEIAMLTALQKLRHATPRQRNGPVYQAVDALRKALGYQPMKIGGDPMDDINEV